VQKYLHEWPRVPNQAKIQEFPAHGKVGEKAISPPALPEILCSVSLPNPCAVAEFACLTGLEKINA
jgi:hypothetical protein